MAHLRDDALRVAELYLEERVTVTREARFADGDVFFTNSFQYDDVRDMRRDWLLGRSDLYVARGEVRREKRAYQAAKARYAISLAVAEVYLNASERIRRYKAAVADEPLPPMSLLSVSLLSSDSESSESESD